MNDEKETKKLNSTDNVETSNDKKTIGDMGRTALDAAKSYDYNGNFNLAKTSVEGALKNFLSSKLIVPKESKDQDEQITDPKTNTEDKLNDDF